MSASPRLFAESFISSHSPFTVQLMLHRSPGYRAKEKSQDLAPSVYSAVAFQCPTAVHAAESPEGPAQTDAGPPQSSGSGGRAGPENLCSE